MIERCRGFLGGEFEQGAHGFFQQVGPKQGGVRRSYPVELDLLVSSEVLRVLPDREPGMLKALSLPDRAGLLPCFRVVTAASGRCAPGLSADRVEGLGDTFHDKERVSTQHRPGAAVTDH